ncbi:MAG: PAS domain S-box protein [Erythrobacter sp.]|nr:MAG: PAS domain S-box protein [Erythrobacter sp.]
MTGSDITIPTSSQPSQPSRSLRAIDTELQLLIDNALNHAVCLLDTDWRITSWNTGAERLYGWTAEEIVGKPYDILFSDDERSDGTPAAMLTLAGQGAVDRRQAWHARKDGSTFRANCSVCPLVNESGTIVGYGSIVHDDTADNFLHSQMAAREAHLRSILETAPDGMITIDEHGIIQWFSTAAERLFGYTADEVVGRNVAILMPEPDAHLHDGFLERYLATGERRVIGAARQVVGRRKDGSLFPHEMFVGEAVVGKRRIFTGFVRDLTAREEADQHLREMQSELLHISRIATAGTMATAMAHEINQPLTAIANYVQSAAAMIHGRPGDELLRSALEEAGREAIRAGAIIQRLRDFVSRGELARTAEPIRHLLTEACTFASIGGVSTSLGCRIDAPASLPAVFVDRVQIQQVLINLIRNAKEAMDDKGTIHITARQDGDFVCVNVRDTGPGLPATLINSVFDPFVSTKATGMGLGLAICRTIIEAHGGKLWCSNASEGGAEFRFTIPKAEAIDG